MRRPDPDLAALGEDTRVVWTEDVLRFRDTDANGHVNNSAFATFCESGRVHFLRHVMAARDPATFFVVARLAIDFRGELHYPGRVRTGTWLSALGRSSVTFEQALLDETGRLVAIAEASVVQMDLASRRPAPFDAGLRATIEGLLRAAPEA